MLQLYGNIKICIHIFLLLLFDKCGLYFTSGETMKHRLDGYFEDETLDVNFKNQESLAKGSNNVYDS
jgi:hypothetical protein